VRKAVALARGVSPKTSRRAAIFAAKVILVFAEAAYFSRWYCLWEWRVARSAFLAEVERRGSTAESRAAALAGVVIAVPRGGPP